MFYFHLADHKGHRTAQDYNTQQGQYSNDGTV